VHDRVLMGEPEGHRHLEALSVYGRTILKFLFLSFRRVLNVICSFLGNSPASEF